MRKPFLIFRAGERTTLKCCVLLLVCTLLLVFSVRLCRSQTEEQESVEVFAGETCEKSRPQGVYALLEQLFGDA